MAIIRTLPGAACLDLCAVACQALKPDTWQAHALREDAHHAETDEVIAVTNH